MAILIPSNIENITNGYVTDAKYIKGVVGVVATLEELNTLPPKTLVVGSRYYVASEQGEYIYDGTQWSRFTGPHFNIENLTWDEIKEISDRGLAGLFFRVGDEKTVMVNNQPHKVRIIGFNHDRDEYDRSIGITFEFVNVISDANGYALATYWKNTSEEITANYDYLNSSVRKALTGQGNGDLHWFEKDSKTFSTTYTNSVLDMLPNDLKKVLRNVKKKVNIHSGDNYVLTDFVDKLFLLATSEIGYKPSFAEDLATYKFYEGHTEQTEAIRIKRQVNLVGGRDTELIGSDIDGEYTEGTKFVLAGYQNANLELGTFMWLRSPNKLNDDVMSRQACHIGENGTSGYVLAYAMAFTVAPAFCI